jgi:molybdate-binding protein/transcriptional regulator with XRE-family HTH domain
MKPSGERQLDSRVRIYRRQRNWSQEELARRAGISRAAVSAIEIQRLVPSVAAALALAAALGCRVEDLFGPVAGACEEPAWAWPPSHEPCRFWHARVGGRLLLFPAEPTAAGVVPHDGLLERGSLKLRSYTVPENTLVMASCDPAAGLLAHEVAATSELRLLVLNRSSREALDLLSRGLVDVAGVHLASAAAVDGNAAAIRSILGPGYSLVKVAAWQEGLAVGPRASASSVQRLLGSRLRWVGREAGSGARQCQDELLRDRPGPRHVAKDHRGVAEAVRCGWADVGVCVRLVCEEASLTFVRIRDEAYDLCFAAGRGDDPRLEALVRVVRSEDYRARLSELPGYDCRGGGETLSIM